VSQTGVPDRRLHGIPFLQQHLDERGADVPAASGDAGHLLVAARRHRRSPSSPHSSLAGLNRPKEEGSLARSPELSGEDAVCCRKRRRIGHVLHPSSLVGRAAAHTWL